MKMECSCALTVKGEALFKRNAKQTDQQDEDERHTYVRRLRAHFEDEPSSIEIQPDIVKHHIKHSKDSAPGPDGVRYSHLKSLSDKEIAELTTVLQRSVDEGEVPEDWLHSHLSPVPKPEKDHSKISSYRIITMQNVVGKLLEKIVARKLSIELEERNLLPATLGSYRQGKDTWANAAVLASDVYDGFERGEETLVAALDLEDAYNRVSYKILLRTLINMEITPALITWIAVAMLKRKVALRMGSWVSEVREITPGLPQGSALSPVLFNIYTVGITSNQLEGPGRTLSFADDILAYRQGRDRQATADNLQEELDRLDNWCEEHDGKLHPDKASVLWCSLNNRAVHDQMPEVSIGGQSIKRDCILRYLGLIFDRSLSGKDHVTRVISKARKGLNVLKVMACMSMPQRILFLLFQTLVLSVVDYGFGLLTLSKAQLTRLEGIQNQAMRIILGCTRDTSCEAMRHMLGLWTMPERHKLAQVKAYLKVSADPKHPLHEKVGRDTHSRLKRGTEWMNEASNTMSQCCNVANLRTGPSWVPVKDDNFIQVIATLGRECREWPEEAVNLEIDSLIEENGLRDHLTVYTDGSVKRRVKSGWGYTASLHGEVIKEDSGFVTFTTSSMCMEVKAITEMLEWVRHQDITRVVCLTDSMSTLEKISTGMLYADWVASINQSNLQSVRWIFCPGHSGVRGNERADALADLAINESALTLDPATVLALVCDHLETQREDTSPTTLTLKNNGFKRGAARNSDLRGANRRRTNQLLTGTISLDTLRWTLQRRGEQLWSDPTCDDPDSTPKY